MTTRQRSKTPSFSSSLLDAIYHSIDGDFVLHKRNNAIQVDEEIESLRRAIRVEKWMESYSTRRHMPSSNSSSLLESHMHKRRKQAQTTVEEKIKNVAKKVKQPLSPGGKIANFLNSIFSPRKLKKNMSMEDWSSMRKSRSMKETTTFSLASRSCLSKSTSSSKGNKSKRVVRFSPDNIILNEDYSITRHTQNSCSFLNFKGGSLNNQEFGPVLNEVDYDLDDRSCTSSDLFELDNIGSFGIEDYQEELPVYGTTNVRMNQAIARGLVI